MKKVFVLTVLVVLLALTASIVGLVSDSSDVTERERVAMPLTKLYENTKYGYSVSFPESHYYFAIPGDYFVEPSTFEDIAFQSNEHNRDYLKIFKVADLFGDVNLKTMSLAEYAELVWDLQVEDQNPNRQDKFVGPLERFELSGSQAYRFKLRDGFKYDAPPPQQSYEGMSVSNVEFSYVYVFDGPHGEKFIANHLVSSATAENMMRTLRFGK